LSTFNLAVSLLHSFLEGSGSCFIYFRYEAVSCFIYFRYEAVSLLHLSSVRNGLWFGSSESSDSFCMSVLRLFLWFLGSIILNPSRWLFFSQELLASTIFWAHDLRLSSLFWLSPDLYLIHLITWSPDLWYLDLHLIHLITWSPDFDIWIFTWSSFFLFWLKPFPGFFFMTIVWISFELNWPVFLVSSCSYVFLHFNIFS